MSIFDGLNDDQIAQILAQVQGSLQPGMTGADGLTQNTPGTGMNAYEAQPPQAPMQQKDVSGFANYGMQAPQLPDPTTGIGNLMSLSNAAQPKRQQQAGMPKGGLMAYLQSLGV